MTDVLRRVCIQQKIKLKKMENNNSKSQATVYLSNKKDWKMTL